jgi:hypothetical protein
MELQGKLCRMCRWKNYNNELPDKEPDGSISNNLYVGGVDSIDQGQDSLVKDGSKLACAIKLLTTCFQNQQPIRLLL